VTKSNGRRKNGRVGSEDPYAVPDERELEQLIADADNPALWNEDEIELGPGFYRAPTVARQLAEVVSAFRAERGLTQEQLGRMLLLHQSQIARIEAGQHTPAIETLVRIAHHLGLTFAVQITPAGASLSLANAVAPARAEAPP